MSLAYTTGGQYVPMVNAKLLAKVIIGGVREEISLDRLMQAAEEDIAREMHRAEAEGVDEKEKAKRINSIFAAKSLRSHQMTNAYGTTSTAAKHYSSAYSDMSAMQSAFLSTAPTMAAPMAYASTGSSSHAYGMPPPSMAAFGGMAPPSSGLFSTATAAPSVAPEMDYELKEDEAVSEEQAERVYQKWQHRKK